MRVRYDRVGNYFRGENARFIGKPAARPEGNGYKYRIVIRAGGERRKTITIPGVKVIRKVLRFINPFSPTILPIRIRIIRRLTYGEQKNTKNDIILSCVRVVLDATHISGLFFPLPP